MLIKIGTNRNHSPLRSVRIDVKIANEIKLDAKWGMRRKPDMERGFAADDEAFLKRTLGASHNHFLTNSTK